MRASSHISELTAAPAAAPEPSDAQPWPKPVASLGGQPAQQGPGPDSPIRHCAFRKRVGVPQRNDDVACIRQLDLCAPFPKHRFEGPVAADMAQFEHLML